MLRQVCRWPGSLKVVDLARISRHTTEWRRPVSRLMATAPPVTPLTEPSGVTAERAGLLHLGPSIYRVANDVSLKHAETADLDDPTYLPT